MPNIALLGGAAAPALATRPRGITSAVRAEAQGPAAVLAELQGAWAEFQTAINARIPDADKIARLETTIATLQASIDANAQAMAALRTGVGGGGGGQTPEAREHSQQLVHFMRTGERPQAAGNRYVDGEGGFLVTPEVDTNVTRVLQREVTMRALANVRAIGAASYKKLHSLGGAAARWSGEGQARTETDTPRLVEIEVTPQSLVAEPALTVELIDDAMLNVEGWIADELAITRAEMEEAAFMTGDGVKKPRGLLSYPVVDNANYSWGNVGVIRSGAANGFATGIAATDRLIDLLHALRSNYRMNGTWLINDLVMGTVRKFKDGQGNLIWQPSLALDQPSTLLGKPVANSDFMPAVAASTLPIAFGDFRRAYQIVDRLGTRILRNPYKRSGYVVFDTIMRVGGGIVDFEAVKFLQIAAD